jgi:hypothetical protein
VVLVLVLVSLAGLLCAGRLIRPRPRTRAGGAGPRGHPESMTAVLAPGEEEYLAWLADQLWPEDEYLALELGDGEEETGGGRRR